ncbi:MAG TPA: DinB family protein [Stellaceae bacterium]|nr:DinB family protein [Stellaceae bacterium]
MCTTIAMLAAMNAADEPSRSYLRAVAELAEMPARLDAIAETIPESEWRRRPAAGGFALVEHVLHLHNIDLEGYRTRVERILTEAMPELADIAGDQLAAERRYLSQDARAARVAFATVRRELVTRLAALGPAERRRAGILEGVGPMTIEELVAIIATHDREHLRELEQLRAEICGG